MFDWIPTDSVLFWIWLAGFVAMSIPVSFVWMINCTFLGDSSDNSYRRKMFWLFNLYAVGMTWFWPIGLIVLGLIDGKTRRRKAKRAKIWAHKKETVPNYWKNYYLIINGTVSDIQVRVLDWEYSKFIPGKARLAMWGGEQRFWAEGKEIIVYWPNKDLEPIPDDEAKV